MTRQLEDKITLPSGVQRSKFDTSIPGQSWTKTPGMYPWDKPPRLNTPDEAMDYFIEKLSDDKIAEQLIGLLSMDVSVATIVDSMMLTAFAEGLFTPDVAILTAEDLSMLIMYLGDSAGVDYKKVDDDQDRELDNAFRGIAQMKTMEEKAKEPELTLSPIASPEDTPDTTQGLMTKPTEEKIEESA